VKKALRFRFCNDFTEKLSRCTLQERFRILIRICLALHEAKKGGDLISPKRRR